MCSFGLFAIITDTSHIMENVTASRKSYNFAFRSPKTNIGSVVHSENRRKISWIVFQNLYNPCNTVKQLTSLVRHGTQWINRQILNFIDTVVHTCNAVRGSWRHLFLCNTPQLDPGQYSVFIDFFKQISAVVWSVWVEKLRENHHCWFKVKDP